MSLALGDSRRVITGSTLVTTMPDPRDDKFLQAIRTSELGARIAADIDSQRLADRQQLADELAKIDEDTEKAYPKAVAAFEKQAAEVRKLEEQLQTARGKLAQLAGARTALSATYTARRADLEMDLAKSASPLIREFVTWCHEELDRTRKLLSTRYWTESNPVTRRRQDRCESNSDQVNARRAALMAAIEAANDMALIADQSGVPQALGTIKGNLPEVREV